MMRPARNTRVPPFETLHFLVLRQLVSVLFLTLVRSIRFLSTALALVGLLTLASGSGSSPLTGADFNLLVALKPPKLQMLMWVPALAYLSFIWGYMEMFGKVEDAKRHDLVCLALTFIICAFLPARDLKDFAWEAVGFTFLYTALTNWLAYRRSQA